MNKNGIEKVMVQVYVGNDEYVTFGKNAYKKFETLYFNALKEVELSGDNEDEYCITIGEHIIILSYAKHILNYLHSAFEGDDYAA